MKGGRDVEGRRGKKGTEKQSKKPVGLMIILDVLVHFPLLDLNIKLSNLKSREVYFVDDYRMVGPAYG